MISKETNYLNHLGEIYRDWISEIDFYQNEIDFLEVLLSQYYSSINKPDFYLKSEQIIKNITNVKADLIHIKDAIYSQNKLLSIIIENKSRGEEALEKNHITLSIDYANLIKLVKEIKSNIYSILLEVLKFKKQKRLM